MGTRRGSPNDDATGVPGPIEPLRDQPITNHEQINEYLIDTLTSTWVQNSIRNGRSIREVPKRIASSDDLLEEELGIGDLDFRKTELRERLGKLVDRGRADVAAVVNALDEAKREIVKLATFPLANDPRFTKHRRRLYHQLTDSLMELIRLREAMRDREPIEDEFVAVYRAALIAVQIDPVLGRKAVQRGRGNPYQQLLKNTRSKLRRARVSLQDISSLLESTGLRQLTRTTRPGSD